MEPKDRIIVALDVDELDEAFRLVDQLHRYVGCFKVGMQLLTGNDQTMIVGTIRSSGGEVFFDGKFKDIPNTIRGATRKVTRLSVKMFNVHIDGGAAMMREAVDESTTIANVLGIPRPLVLGVTVLTSLSFKDLIELGVEHVVTITRHDHGLRREILEQSRINERVMNLALLAKECGLDGVIASPLEAPVIRNACGQNFLIVTPGIRPTWAPPRDQKRYTTPSEAIRAGADYLVIGQPITKPPKEIGDPVEAAKRIADEIATAYVPREGVTT